MSAERDALAALVAAWDSEAYNREWGQRMTAAIAAARAALAAPAQGEPQPEDDFVIPCAIDGCKQPSQMPASEYCSLHSAIGTSPTGGEFAPAPSAEPPAQAAPERMGTHWETCATDGGPRHYDCALRLIEQQAREIARWNELHRFIAEELDCDQETWPDHRNAPLAIGTTFVLIKQRAERAEAERDALREVVKAADAMRAECDQVPPMVQQRNALHAYDTARAKVKP